MLPKLQLALQLVGFVTIGASLFMGDKSPLVGAIGGLMFLLGMVKWKKKK
ncbi:hypothetical protein JOC37_002563 [Desulfohalotomaculum tongense]|nr:hypothetical protein [Desulforadius tongensis]MBM7856133.1 hypothetical protein [Desulforadius tongensis]